jgi:hypothetical protein
LISVHCLNYRLWDDYPSILLYLERPTQ